MRILIKDRALLTSLAAAAALLTCAPAALAASSAKPTAGKVVAGQVALLRNDGRRATVSPRRLALSAGKADIYASFSVPKTWASKQVALTLTASRDARVTVAAVRVGELSSLRWPARARSVGASVSSDLPAAKATTIALPRTWRGRVVLHISTSSRTRATITSVLQLKPRTGSSAPSAGKPADGDQPAVGAPDSGGPTVSPELPSGETPPDPGTPADPGPIVDPNSPFADLLPQLIGAPLVSAPALTEASGLAESAVNPGVYWTHNDSGDRARLFAIDGSTGTLRATVELSGVAATDWEDLAIAPDAEGNDAFYIADIGDNSAVRGSVVVYRVAEPTLPPASGATVTINAGAVNSQRLTFPGGPRDAESLAVGSDGALTVISKRETQVGVYRLADPQFLGGRSQLTSVGRLPLTWVVGASASPDGSFVLIKTAGAVRGYAIDGDESVADALVRGGAGVNLPYNAEPQGEAVSASLTGRGHATLSEGISQPLQQWRW